ncbi:MAG: DUF2271 domain-containing protein [Bacteroidales bacterium]|nr:DUF2271 domain-containing protein [Bacteroidales bacterium]
MIKKIALIAAALVLGLATSCQKKSETLELSFNYTPQPGPGSNQYAAWIENSNGEVVKTLFVTAYTTKGRSNNGEELVRGYIKRPACVPVWVKTVNAEALSDAQLDAFSGATPSGGVQCFCWDFTDENGNSVAKGSYKVCLEATLYGNSDILYTGEFTVGAQPGEIALSSTLTEPDESHAGMITDVKAELK